MKVIRTTEYAAEAWTTDDPRIANAMAASVEGCVASLDGSYCDPGSGRALGVYVFGAAGRSGGYLRADAEEIRFRIDYVREPGCGFEYYGGYSHEAEALEMLEGVRARGWEARMTDTAADPLLEHWRGLSFEQQAAASLYR